LSILGDLNQVKLWSAPELAKAVPRL
jgi:hypothetical protein